MGLIAPLSLLKVTKFRLMVAIVPAKKLPKLRWLKRNSFNHSNKKALLGEGFFVNSRD